MMLTYKKKVVIVNLGNADIFSDEEEKDENVDVCSNGPKDAPSSL